jgi:hypothetical protein
MLVWTEPKYDIVLQAVRSVLHAGSEFTMTSGDWAKRLLKIYGLISRQGNENWEKSLSFLNRRILTMAYNTQNYWVSGFCPLSGILNTRKHSVSETMRETLTLLGPLERANHGPAVYPPTSNHSRWYAQGLAGRCSPLHRSHHRGHLPVYDHEHQPETGQYRALAMHRRSLLPVGESHLWEELSKLQWASIQL